VVEYVKRSHKVDKDTIKLEKAVTGKGVFVGRYTHSLDPKRRLTIPSVWRAQIGVPEVVYALPDFHKPYLALYTVSEMERRLEKLQQYSLTDEKAREAFSTIGEYSDMMGLDSQGRIRINDKLLSFAGITDRVILNGAFNRIELWSSEKRSEPETVDQEALRKAASLVDF